MSLTPQKLAAPHDTKEKRGFWAILFAVFCLLQPLPVNAHSSSLTPHDIIGALHQNIYKISEISGKQADYEQAERGALQQLRDYIHDNGDSSALTEKDKSDMTPLIKAAFLGFADIVGELVRNPSVASSLNDVDKNRISAWVYSNFALRQSMLACNPTVVQNIFALVPLAVTQQYYMPRDAYRRTRELLRQAGAEADIAKAKDLWQSICQKQSDQTREKVSASNDLLSTVTEEGLAILATAMQQK